MEAREKALHTIVKLRTLANHPNTPKPEAEAARTKIKVLEEKHQITSTEKPPIKPAMPWLNDYMRDMARQQAASREAARNRQRNREEAQRAYEQSMADKDDRGQPKPNPDPWSDPRTHAQRQADLNNSFGKNDAWYRQNFTSTPGWASQNWTTPSTPKSGPMPNPRCSPALPFFTIGGEPQMRNKATATCAKCGNNLIVGAGAHTPDGVVCCDMVPRPRQKKSAQSD